MIYSVYNHDSKVYDYYEGSGPRGTHAGAPPVSSGRNQLGATVEQAAWRMPIDAKKIGSGELPRGRVASMGGIGGLGDILEGGFVRTGLVIGALYLAWRHFR